MRHDAGELQAAVAESGGEVIGGVEVLALGFRCQQLLTLFLIEHDVRLFKLAVYHGVAFDDILLAALLFKPRSYLVSRFGGLDYIQPIAVGTLSFGIRCDNLNYHAGLNIGIKRHHLAIYFGADHAVADC